MVHVTVEVDQATALPGEKRVASATAGVMIHRRRTGVHLVAAQTTKSAAPGGRGGELAARPVGHACRGPVVMSLIGGTAGHVDVVTPAAVVRRRGRVTSAVKVPSGRTDVAALQSGPRAEVGVV
jgi:hypothetical protein